MVWLGSEFQFFGLNFVSVSLNSTVATRTRGLPLSSVLMILLFQFRGIFLFLYLHYLKIWLLFRFFWLHPMLYEENVALCEVHYLKHGWKFEDLGDIHTQAIVGEEIRFLELSRYCQYVKWGMLDNLSLMMLYKWWWLKGKSILYCCGIITLLSSEIAFKSATVLNKHLQQAKGLKVHAFRRWNNFFDFLFNCSNHAEFANKHEWEANG